MTDYSFIRPLDPPPNANRFDIESWKLDLLWKRRGIYMDNKMKLNLGPIFKDNTSKVETHQNYAQCKADYDSLH
jgi:hypothetical protein